MINTRQSNYSPNSRQRRKSEPGVNMNLRVTSPAVSPRIIGQNIDSRCEEKSTTDTNEPVDWVSSKPFKRNRKTSSYYYNINNNGKLPQVIEDTTLTTPSHTSGLANTNTREYGEEDDYSDPFDAIENENIYNEPILESNNDWPESNVPSAQATMQSVESSLSSHQKANNGPLSIPNINTQEGHTKTELHSSRKHSLGMLFSKISSGHSKQDKTETENTKNEGQGKRRKFSLQEHRLSSVIYNLVKGQALSKPPGKWISGSYQTNSSSWEFLNQDENENTCLNNCFEVRKGEVEATQSEDKKSLYESECDSGRSTMDSTHIEH